MPAPQDPGAFTPIAGSYDAFHTAGASAPNRPPGAADPVVKAPAVEEPPAQQAEADEQRHAEPPP